MIPYSLKEDIALLVAELSEEWFRDPKAEVELHLGHFWRNTLLTGKGLFLLFPTGLMQTPFGTARLVSAPKELTFQVYVNGKALYP